MLTLRVIEKACWLTIRSMRVQGRESQVRVHPNITFNLHLWRSVLEAIPWLAITLPETFPRNTWRTNHYELCFHRTQVWPGYFAVRRLPFDTTFKKGKANVYYSGSQSSA
jgi:hypothetical protein